MQTRQTLSALFTFIGLSLFVGVEGADAQSLNAITFTLDKTSTQGYEGNLGIDFNVNSAITLTQLGAYNDTGLDFITPKTVQIWNRNLPDAPLFQITIQPGQGTLRDGVRFVDIPTLTLPIGFQGTLSAYGFNDTDRNYNTNTGSLNTSHQLTTDPLISWQDNGSGFVMNRYDANVNRLPQNTNFQANFQLPNASFRGQAASVPSPSSALVLGIGGLATILLRRRRNKVEKFYKRDSLN